MYATILNYGCKKEKQIMILEHDSPELFDVIQKDGRKPLKNANIFNAI